MKIKYTLFVLALMLIALNAMAYLGRSFPGYDTLTDKSSDIIVVRCARTPDPYNQWKNGHRIDNDGLIDSDVEIISVLKGQTNSGIVHIAMAYWLKEGDYYLLFQNYIDGSYDNVENYRVIPIGTRFSTNSISGKSLDERIQLLFRYATNNLAGEIKNDEETKDRLTQALQK